METIEDPTNILLRILPEQDDPSFQCLGHIDWYGDTVFNHLRAPQLHAEWLRSRIDAHDPEARRVFEGVLKLVVRLQAECHVYPKFYGD